MASPVFRSAQSDPIDLDRLADDLRAAYPQLGAIAPLRLLGVGFGGVVVATAGDKVVQIARNHPAMEGYAREARLLPTLSVHLPVAIPTPTWLLAPTARFPYGALIYPLLPGTPLSPERLIAENTPLLALDLATFLLALHRFRLSQALALGAPSHGARALYDAQLVEAALVALVGELSRAEYAAAHDLASEVRHNPYADTFARTLIHGDLWYDNILVDGAARHVLGVVDLERATEGDPAEDFATLSYLGEPFVTTTLASYRMLGGDPGARLAERMVYHHRKRELLGVGFAALYDPAELTDAIAKLRAIF